MGNFTGGWSATTTIKVYSNKMHITLNNLPDLLSNLLQFIGQCNDHKILESYYSDSFCYSVLRNAYDTYDTYCYCISLYR